MGGWGVHKILEDELAKYKIGTIHSSDAIYILFFSHPSAISSDDIGVV